MPSRETPSEQHNEDATELPESVRDLEIDHIHDLRTQFEQSFIETDTGSHQNQGSVDGFDKLSDSDSINIVSNLNDAIDSSEAATIAELPPPVMCKERENRLVMPAGPSRTDDLLARAAAGPRTK